MTTLAADIAAHLELHGYESSINGQSRTLTESEVTQVLDRARSVLYDESIEDGTTFEIAHILVMKSGPGLDVYLHSGEYQ